MVNRRFILKLIASAPLSLALSSCGQLSQNHLNILLLQSSIPPQLIAAFKKNSSTTIPLKFKPYEQLQELSRLLQDSTDYQGDLLTLDQFTLATAIAKGQLQPFDGSQLPQWQDLPEQLKTLIHPSSQTDQALWGIPYRWGYTAIAYRSDLLTQENLPFPTDWADLWQEEYRNRIGLLNQPREIIGLTLKHLGYSYNTPNLQDLPELKPKLRQLHQQTQFYHSTAYLQPLILGDSWITVGWLNDIFPIQKRYPNINMVIPPSGTALWADLWVQPQSNLSLSPQKQELLYQWLKFCWQPNAVSHISRFTSAPSPLIPQLGISELSPDLTDNSFLNINPKILAKSELIMPLAPESQQQYRKLWQEIINR